VDKSPCNKLYSWTGECTEHIWARRDVDIRICHLPQSKESVDIAMMKPKDWIERSNSRVSHVTAPPDVDVNGIMDTFKRSQAGHARMNLLPCMIGELSPRVGLEELVREKIKDQSLEIGGRELLIRNIRSGDCTGALAGGLTQSCRPYAVNVPVEGRVDRVKAVSLQRVGAQIGQGTVSAEDLNRVADPFVGKRGIECPVPVRETPSLRRSLESLTDVSIGRRVV